MAWKGDCLALVAGLLPYFSGRKVCGPGWNHYPVLVCSPFTRWWQGEKNGCYLFDRVVLIRPAKSVNYAKSLKLPVTVIPAQAGIDCFL
jgi:hypothetical protein